MSEILYVSGVKFPVNLSVITADDEGGGGGESETIRPSKIYCFL